MSLLEEFTKYTKNSLEKTMLECSIYFTFNRDKRIDEIKGNLFIETVFTLLVHQNKPCTAEDFSKIYPMPGEGMEVEEFESAFKILKKNGYVERTQGGWIPIGEKVESVKNEVKKTEEAFSIIIEDILCNYTKKQNCNLTSDEMDQAKINIQESLSLYARLHSMDCLINDDYDRNFNNDDEETDLIKCAKQNLDESKGDLLVEVIAEVLSKPSESQAETIDLLIKSFVFSQIMQVDPMLNQFAVDQLKKKTFILDTDFVLNCITSNHSLSAPYRKLISTLKRIGCNLIIPYEVLEEVVRHAKSAERNNGWFKHSFETLDSEIIEKEATNVFVKDYYLWKIKTKKANSLKSFMKRYYDDIQPIPFMKQLIKDELDITVSEDKLGILEEQRSDFDTLKDKIKTIIERSFKNDFRDPWENESLAKTDALLYFNTLAINQDLDVNNRGILSHNAYLITYTTKSIRCAKEMNIHKDIVTRPEILINILSRIGTIETKKQNNINLFDNPFLTYIMRKNWDIIKKVADVGIDLHDTTITRLRFDLEDTINIVLTDNADSDNIDSYRITEGTDPNSVNSFMNLIDTIEKKHYKIIPEIQAVADSYKEMKKELEQEKAAREKAEEFKKDKTKRHEHYMRMMEERKNEDGKKKNNKQLRSRRKRP